MVSNRGFFSAVSARLGALFSAGPEKSLSDADRFAALKPVLASYSLFIGIYHLVVVADRVFNQRIGQEMLLGLSLATLAVAFGIRFAALPRLRTVWQLNLCSLLINLAVFANPLAYQMLHFDGERLIYFVFLSLIFTVSATSNGVAVVSLAGTLATLAAIALIHRGRIAPENAALILLMVVSSTLLASVVRRNLFRAVAARVSAEVAAAEATALAECDALTGLPNRRSFFRETDLKLAAVEARGDAEAFDLALIDLDGFKPVNDIYGHSVGDALLVEVGRRLTRLCHGRAFAARMGGDEFALIIPGALSEDERSAFGKALCESLRDSYQLGGVIATISASVGLVRCVSGHTPAHWMERADYALYFAKQNLRGAPVVFTEGHEAEMRDFSQVDQTLRASDLDAELSIVFQPQVDVVAQKVVSFEALARWKSARLGDVRPDIFIKAAERSGLITDITLLLLRKALHQVRDWPADLRVSFNLSARDLRSSRSITNICTAVADSGIDPRRIEFEITETAMLTDFDQACEALNRLKALGCRIAVDDFGSGYSSFSYIHRLPVDKIKIDRSFVVQLLKHDTAVQIIKTIIDLCCNLDLDCVIEGVETEAEMIRLTQVRARYVQGYLFGRPMPASQIAGYLADDPVVAKALPALVMATA